MSNIRNVQWNEGVPALLMPGMLVQFLTGIIELYGSEITDTQRDVVAAMGVRWAWLVKPHELTWLEDMANKHKARARG
ncbi:hypothetical protein UJK07_15585 [Pseudomonas aeruginosa]|uniref:hypothetical protein n=1 Tax=Pseudomonas aeruginosa TaxID=287 RepID=UPI00276DD813|nr:hypothetical protein [Pseudomonas aeruginosa]MED5113377.1 hypothetical protein [Pseudomonas aeruginosa]MED5125305.1 hypothetical protein [Pseudomonas aeruginosa]